MAVSESFAVFSDFFVRYVLKHFDGGRGTSAGWSTPSGMRVPRKLSI
jgi:hypothetical protein